MPILIIDAEKFNLLCFTGYLVPNVINAAVLLVKTIMLCELKRKSIM